MLLESPLWFVISGLHMDSTKICKERQVGQDFHRCTDLLFLLSSFTLQIVIRAKRWFIHNHIYSFSVRKIGSCHRANQLSFQTQLLNSFTPVFSVEVAYCLGQLSYFWDEIPALSQILPGLLRRAHCLFFRIDAATK